MKTALEAIVDFFLLTILILIAFSFIIMHLNEQNARNFHALAVDKLENSNFSNDAANGLKAEAKRMGYQLDIWQIKINGLPSAELVLNYDYSIPIFHIFGEPQAIRGTAR